MFYKEFIMTLFSYAQAIVMHYLSKKIPLIIILRIYGTAHIEICGLFFCFPILVLCSIKRLLNQ